MDAPAPAPALVDALRVHPLSTLEDESRACLAALARGGGLDEGGGGEACEADEVGGWRDGRAAWAGRWSG